MTGENRRAIVRGGFRLNPYAGAMVYCVMWRCTKCEYHNDDWDEACSKCGAARSAASDATEVLAVPEQQQTANAEANTRPGHKPMRTITPVPTMQIETQPKRRDPVVLLATLLIFFMLATLGLLGYIAWQRGLIKLPEPAGQQELVEGSMLDEPAELTPVVEDPLLNLADSREREAKPYKSIAKQLLDSREQLSGLAAPPPGQDDELTPDQQALLDQLNTLGLGLLTLCKDFEETAGSDSFEGATGYHETLVEEFTTQFTRITQLIGQVYGSNTSSTHEAYLLPDLIKSTVAVGRRFSLAGIDEAWTQAKEARVQRKLEAQYPEEIRQLTARLEALKEVHRDFKSHLDALPPYEVRAGNLNKAAEDALTLLDSLMINIEALVEEHDQYSATLVGIEQSNRMEQLEEEFVGLAQDDHYFCFGEICRISVDDENLQLPVYVNLRQHYEFVNQRWPELSIGYLEVFNDSERDWRTKWGKAGPGG